MKSLLLFRAQNEFLEFLNRTEFSATLCSSFSITIPRIDFVPTCK
jgi:hypothetical protein